MAEERPQRPAHSETRDISVRWVIITGVSTLAFIGVATILLFVFYSQPSGALGNAVSPTDAVIAVTTERQQRLAFEQKESEALNSYGWVDRSAGIAHIPIAEAMALLAAQGTASPVLATRQEPSP